jgi:hypothetical protein
VSHRDQYSLYINDLPKIVNDNAEVVLYVDHTSIIIANLNPTDFINCANKILQGINKWFTTNLSLNDDKTQYMQFVTKTISLIDLHIMNKNKETANTSNTEFLRLTLDNTFSWKNNIDVIVPKLNSACFTVRAVKTFLSQESLRMVYFYFHSIMTYGLVFWNNSYHSSILCIMYGVWCVMTGLFMYLCYFDTFYIPWHHLAKKDVWNKVHMNININMKYNID